jgi:hypothetical protein
MHALKLAGCLLVSTLRLLGQNDRGTITLTIAAKVIGKRWAT